MLVFSWKSAVIEEEKVYGKKKDLRKGLDDWDLFTRMVDCIVMNKWGD
jgi:hypothetical protein